MKLSIVFHFFALASLFPNTLGDAGGLRDGAVSYFHDVVEDVKERVLEAQDKCVGVACTSGDGDVNCISGDSHLQVQNMGTVSIKDLQIGDMVLTASKGYQPVYAFGHYFPTQVEDLLHIQMKHQSLKMTNDHMIFVHGKTNPIRADGLKVGDLLVRADGNPEKVTSIKSVQVEGLYAPLTASGTLVVDGVATSSYTALQTDHEELVTLPLIGTSMHVSHQGYVHWTLAPFRVLCGGISSQLCHMYTEGGVPHYIDVGVKAHQWAHGYGGIVETIFLAVATALIFVFRLIEVTVGVKAVGPMACLGLAGWIYHKNRDAPLSFAIGGQKKTV